MKRLTQNTSVTNNYHYLDKYLAAHDQDYELALGEIKAGEKKSHWIWYIFPQMRGLGCSLMSYYYGIRSVDEAIGFLNHPVLGAHLKEISKALLDLPTDDIVGVVGNIDALKVQSCMTLFDAVSDDRIFADVLDKFYEGEKDAGTLIAMRL